MSRSYKDGRYIKQPADQEMKKFANKTVRHTEDLPLKGSFFKKLFCSYNISDYNWFEQNENKKKKGKK